MVDRWLARKAITKRGDVIHSHYGQPDAEEFDVPTFFNHRTITEEFNLQTTVVKLVCANGEVTLHVRPRTEDDNHVELPVVVAAVPSKDVCKVALAGCFSRQVMIEFKLKDDVTLDLRLDWLAEIKPVAFGIYTAPYKRLSIVVPAGAPGVDKLVAPKNAVPDASFSDAEDAYEDPADSGDERPTRQHTTPPTDAGPVRRRAVHQELREDEDADRVFPVKQGRSSSRLCETCARLAAVLLGCLFGMFCVTLILYFTV